MIETKQALDPLSNTIIRVNMLSNEFNLAIQRIQREFIESTISCNLRLIIRIFGSDSNFTRRLQCARTSEVLEVKYITGNEACQLFGLTYFEMSEYDGKLFLQRKKYYA
ncbi:hypothetical protein DdX_17985 [Ditylenchus destructor]|uniref:Uncharacterized protein n=1 Tax=Ditylenchus destructor TaxID=166010 RepID=A0AAD4MKH4_9BILA|nr:hypothetical protein DdX_17985 [Ditylenchus destructor]